MHDSSSTDSHSLASTKKVPARLSYRVSGLSLLLGLLLIAVDQVTKGLVFLYLPQTTAFHSRYPYGGVGVFENFLGIEFSLNYVTNTGAAWGLFGAHPQLLIFFRIFLILGLLFYLLFYNSHKRWQLPLTLIIAGAIANVIDFFVYGHVVDMLHFVFWGYDFPVFNLADSAISMGIISCFMLSFFKE